MWPFGSSLRMPKLDTPLFQNLTIFTDDPTLPSRLTLEEYVEKEKYDLKLIQLPIFLILQVFHTATFLLFFIDI